MRNVWKKIYDRAMCDSIMDGLCCYEMHAKAGFKHSEELMLKLIHNMNQNYM